MSNREQQLEAALRDLVEACGCVRPISRDVSLEKVSDVRFAMKFMAAWEAAQAVLAIGEELGEAPKESPLLGQKGAENGAIFFEGESRT